MEQHANLLDDYTSSDTSDDDDIEPVTKRRKIELPLRTIRDVNYFSQFYPTLENIEWMCSHLDPDYIIWSSNPQILAPRFAQKSNHYVVEEDNVPTTVIGACDVEHAIKCARDIIKSGLYEHMLIIAGAGCSVDSTDEHGQKLPDYRTSGALWKKQIASVDKTMEEIDNPILFETDPALVWGMFTYKMKLFLNAKPHDGYERLKTAFNDYFVMTSNVDGLFHKSGFKHVYECHGSLLRLQCTNANCKQQVWNISKQETEMLFEQLDTDQVRLKNSEKVKYPLCPTCSAIARPNVSMHGDTNLTYNEQVNDEQKSELKSWIYDIWRAKKKLLVVEIGCGVSLHSLRVESDCLVNRDPTTTQLIRINNMDPSCATDHVITIQSNAVDALVNLF
jgi:NAD-dependent SIR2 family protein deacetylase